MKYNSILTFLFTVSAALLAGCGPEIEKKDLRIILVADHAISDGKAPNRDLMALLAPIAPGTDHNYGFIPQVTVLRTDISKNNEEELDLSDIRTRLGLLPSSDFDYAAGLRRNALQEKSKPFKIEELPSTGLKTNTDSLVKARYPGAVLIQYANNRQDSGKYIDQIDSLLAYMRNVLYRKDADLSRPIVIVYRTKAPDPPVVAESKPEAVSAPVELEKAAFTDCHTLTWPNNVPGINYKVTWPNFSQNLGNVGLFQIPQQFRNKKLNVTLCAYANGYDSVVKCAQMPYKPCAPAAAGAPRTVNTPIAAEEPIGDMGLRILKEGSNRGKIQWVQRKGYVYRISIKRSDESNSTFIDNLLYSTAEGTMLLDRNDPKIKGYIKNDAAHTFVLRAYKLDVNSGKEVFQVCRMLPALSFRTVGLNSGVGFTDSYCDAQRVDNAFCK